MQIEHKILIFAIVAALLSVLSIVAYNTYDSTVRVNAYKECLAMNKEISEMITSRNSDSLRITSIPTCYTR